MLQYLSSFLDMVSCLGSSRNSLLEPAGPFVNVLPTALPLNHMRPLTHDIVRDIQSLDTVDRLDSYRL